MGLILCGHLELGSRKPLGMGNRAYMSVPRNIWQPSLGHPAQVSPPGSVRARVTQKRIPSAISEAQSSSWKWLWWQIPLQTAVALPWTMVWKLLELLAGVAGCDLKIRLTFLKKKKKPKNKTPPQTTRVRWPRENSTCAQRAVTSQDYNNNNENHLLCT